VTCEVTPVIFRREVDEQIVQCDIAGLRSAIDAARRLQPELGADGIEVAGGFAAFTGVGSPLSEAIGVGSQGPVDAAEIAEITAFYQSHGTRPRVFVTPLADPSLARVLAQAGYVPIEYSNVLASDRLDSFARRDERIAVTSDVEAWSHASARAFTGREILEPGDETIATVIASCEGVIALEACENGAIVATAAMDVRLGCAGLFAGSTMGEFRNRGWQIALICDRIARAREAGANLLRAGAAPGSTSERNFQRCGFVTLYTRVLWELPEPPMP